MAARQTSATLPTPAPADDEPHIKRPQNSWILYRSQKLKEYRGPKKEQSSYSQMLGAQWAAEPPEVKEHYKMLSETMKREHAAANPGYKYKPKSKAEKEAIREAKRLEKEEEKRRKADARGASSMPIRTKPRRNVSDDDDEHKAVDKVEDGDALMFDPDPPSNITRKLAASNKRVASPKPKPGHFQPYRTPGSYYPPSAYGRARISNGSYSRLTPPLSSADATPQLPTSALPGSQDLAQEPAANIVFTAPTSLYNPLPSLDPHSLNVPYPVHPKPQAWSRNSSNQTHSLPLSPPEEGNHTAGNPPTAIDGDPSSGYNPSEFINMWPNLEAGFTWPVNASGMLANGQVAQPPVSDWDSTAENSYVQWFLPADAEAQSPSPRSVPTDMAPPSSLPARPLSQPHLPHPSALKSRQLDIVIPKSAIPISNGHTISPDRLVTGLSLSETAVAPSAISPTPVESGHVPLTINFPPGFNLPSVPSEGNAGGFWDEFVSSNFPVAPVQSQSMHTSQPLSCADHPEIEASPPPPVPTINSLTQDDFGWHTGAGGPALNMGPSNGLSFDLDDLDWGSFAQYNGGEVNLVPSGEQLDDQGLGAVVDVSQTFEIGVMNHRLGDVGMRSSGNDMHGMVHEQEDEQANMSFGSMVSIPNNDVDEMESLRHRTSSHSLRIVTPSEPPYFIAEDEKTPYVPPAGAANSSTRRVGGHWAVPPTLQPVTLHQPQPHHAPQMSPTTQDRWNQPTDETIIGWMGPQVNHNGYQQSHLVNIPQRQPRHHSEQLAPSQPQIYRQAPRVHSSHHPMSQPAPPQEPPAPPRSNAPQVQTHACSPPSDGPPPIPPRPPVSSSRPPTSSQFGRPIPVKP